MGMKYKNIKTYNEICDDIETEKGRVDYLDINVYPFIVNNDMSIVNGTQSSTHSSITDYTDELIRGRIYIDQKIVSFWDFDELEKTQYKKLFNSISKHFDVDLYDDNWRIDLLLNETSNDVSKDYFHYEIEGYGEGESVLIPINDFLKNDDIKIDSDKEQQRLHIMKQKEKQEYYKKYGKNSGWGSELKMKKNPIEWEQAKRTSENLKYIKPYKERRV